MKKTIAIFLLKIVVFTIPVFVCFEILFRLGFYPVITDSTIFDLKMMQFQRSHIRDIKVLAIGSSITMYELNSGIMERCLNKPYYNFGSWSLQIADMRALLNSFVKDYKPEYVIICSSIGDFIYPQNDSYLSYSNTNSYIRNNFPEFFYFKNYSSIHQIVYRKSKAYRPDLDKWGGATMTIGQKDINKEKWNEHDIFPTKYTPGQYEGLDSLGEWLRQQNVRFIFVQAPIKASYANTPLSKQILHSHFDKCRSIVEGRGGVYLNYYDTTIFTDSLFFDQYHLQAAGGIILTKEIVADLKKIIK